MSDDVTIPPIDIGSDQPEEKLFTIIKRGELCLVDRETGAGVRPCSHPTYILDDEYMTVTCGKCKERLEPYAILRHNAAVLEHIRRAREEKNYAEQRLLGAACRDMLKRSCFTDEERERWSRRTYLFGNSDVLKSLRELHKQLEERVRDAKRIRRAKKLHRAARA